MVRVSADKQGLRCYRVSVAQHNARHAVPARGNAGLKYALIAIGVALVALIAILGFAKPWEGKVPQPQQSEGVAEQTQSAPAEVPQSEPEPEPLAPLDFTISAGGDMLIHMPVAESAWNGQTWDFSSQMTLVEPYLQGSDIALCNMETAMVPYDQAPSGYPIFGTPRSLADSMAASGWNGCSTSSNHSLDQGLQGVYNTLDFLEAAGLGAVGTARTEVEADAPQFYEIQGVDQSVKVAHIAAAHNTNGIPIPEEAPWAINLIDIPRIISQAQAARAEGADIVLATIHCCEIEYVTAVEDQQIEAAQQLAASGVVDAIISHHPHVPRTIDFVEGGPGGNGMWVAYGLGNFISNQTVEAVGAVEASTGMMVFFDGVKNEGQAARLVGAEWMAVTTDIPAGHIVRPLIGGVAQDSYLSEGELADRYARMLAIMEGSPATEIAAVPDKGANTTTVIPRVR